MKKIIRLFDDDIREIIEKYYEVKPDKVTSVFSQDEEGCDEFYIEVETYDSKE